MATGTRVALYPWRLEAFRKAWEAGACDREAADLLQISRHAATTIRKHLGLAPHRRRVVEAPGAKMRKCLMCGRGFQSAHAGHRICDTCKLTSAWRAGAF